jgi:hypothetical protein
MDHCHSWFRHARRQQLDGHFGESSNKAKKKKKKKKMVKVQSWPSLTFLPAAKRSLLCALYIHLILFPVHFVSLPPPPSLFSGLALQQQHKLQLATRKNGILDWHCSIATFSFYLPDRTNSAHLAFKGFFAKTDPVERSR